MFLNRLGNRRRTSARTTLSQAEPLEPRAMMAGDTGGGYSRPDGLPPASEPTAYFDVSTGVMQLDPVGHNLSLVNFTYNTEVANITGSSPGPFVYPAGTVKDAVSTATEKKTFPSGEWTLITTFPARFGGAITLINDPTLDTSGPNSASTNGWFNQPWSFGAVVAPGALSMTDAQHNLIAITSTDVGFGPGRGLFQYTEFGVVGTFYGRIQVVDSSVPNSVIGMSGNELIVSRSNGSTFDTAPLATLPPGETWVNTVSGDFDGDGLTDVASQTAAGSWWVVTNSASGSPTVRRWGDLATFQFPTVGDFDGDGKDDIAVRNEANGAWRVLKSTGTAFSSSRFGRWNPSLAWSNVLAGDFNGDGKADLVGRRSDAAWVVSTSTGTAFTSNIWALLSIDQFGTVGDFNGDGKDDVAVRNATNGSWRVMTSTGTHFVSSRFGRWNPDLQWANVLAGDFNGDGKTDLVGQRSDGAWVVSTSTGTSFASNIWTYLSIDQFASVGDFNTDGKSDVAVRNATNGSWRILSSTGTRFTSIKAGSWPTSQAWDRAFAARS